MIGLDTNVLVRFLTQDDPEQGAVASRVMAGLTRTDPAFVSREVLVELVWVLERAYGFDRLEVAQTFDGLLDAQELVLESADRVAVAIDRYRRGGAGFADQMVALAGQRAGCTATLTFDRKAADLPGMELLQTATQI
jgi:predicted nucleic-acid-binding protein